MRIVLRDNLIFGCSTITDHDTLEESLRLLAQASVLGIVHFDTARGYGAGQSEVVLGRYLRDRRDQVIVTTKYGLAPPVNSQAVARAYARAASVQRGSTAVNLLRRARKALRPSPLSPAKIRTNLETSLRALGTDYVDYFLLHEATGDQARRDTIARTLDQLIKDGKVREVGIGSAYSKIGPGEVLIPASYRVLQFEHNPLARAGLEADARQGRLIFTHSALKVMGQVTELLERHPELVRRVSGELDVDLSSPKILPGLLLAYSHARNPNGKVIFSTRSHHRLIENVTTFSAIREWDADRLLALQNFFDELSSEAVLD